MLGLTYILLPPTSDLPASILMSSKQIISSIVTMTQQMKEEGENPGKHHGDDGIINDDAKENGLKDDDYFDGFHKNEDVNSEADSSTMRMLMGFMIMRMLLARLTMPIWMC